MKTLRTVTAFAFGFLAGIYVASTSKQIAASLAAARAAGPVPADVDPQRARSAARLRAYGVEVPEAG